MLQLRRSFYSLCRKELRFTLQSGWLATGPQKQQIRLRTKKAASNLSALFTPVPVKPNQDDEGIGKELAGTIPKAELIKLLNKFYQMSELKQLSVENGLDSYLQHQAYLSFRRFCLDSDCLPADLHITICDIMNNVSHVSNLLPYYLRHARQMFPHLECMDDLKRISDLTTPPSWYPNARSMQRRFIIHAGPTNSGKTYHALERFLNAKSGVYCGPLKLLATEVYKKSNERGTPCDLVTGEERKFALNENHPASHVSCTVEMTSVNTPYEVAVIDEIQLLKDPGRGWAWTRALLGVMAEEIHLCGEEASIDLISALALTCNENVEICRYKRLTDLTIEHAALVSLDNVQPGDCIVCFNKNDIYKVSRELETKGKEIAVIYGGLPPGTKLAQAQKFNDPDSTCKILVATDAIGMGLNLSIRRVIFYSLVKPIMNEKGEKELDVITISQALQIAGRAGRYGTKFEKGFVTTFKSEDLPVLQNLLSQSPELIEKAGLHPTAEQIEMYAYHLPNSSLSNLMTIFEGICTVDDSLYFMCNTEDFKYLAEMIQHVPLPLRSRYLFCCAPINRKMPFVCSLFLKFARLFCKNEAVTFNWLCKAVYTPFSIPKSIGELVHLEAVFDVLDLYLWLSIRFPDLFPAVHQVRALQSELDEIIQQGVTQITRLLEASDVIVKDESSEDEYCQDSNYKQHQPTNKPFSSKGKLTDKLMHEGLITPNMLYQLQKEWAMQSRSENSISSKMRRKRKPRH
ncbi:ATP-dependent RNA helicase SUV3 homolog, mitochondrial [Cimex lectularius]|uniref:ATP-dependent RNA helicase SUV3 homolog, mitochondrial n=1 Tax=Cimex lectularius TaxID=79782 RepID=A0A8I6RAG7_CIMLE|nr:ATP-dependent RNA helicase SUV3 homolog, mitochondrial [Cimex lectularius]